MSTATATSGALALLNQGGGLGSELRSALESFGANVVFEAPVQALDHLALKNSGARVVVINLGGVDDDIDDLLDALGAEDYEIVINDNEVSAQLAGADQARWARHLAAKILHRPEIILPPAPAGAEAIPSFAEHWAARVPSADEPGRASVQIATAPAIEEKPVVDVETPAPTHLAAQTAEIVPVAAIGVLSELDETPAVETETLELAPMQTHEADPVIAESTANANNTAATPETELDADVEFKRALKSFEDAEGHAGAGDGDLHDLDALLAAASAANEMESVPPLGAARAAAEAEAAASNSASATTGHWSLAPLSEGESAALTAAGELEEFHVEKIPAEVYLAPQAEAEHATSSATEESDSRKTSDLDFLSSLELVPLESELPPDRTNSVLYDTGRDLLQPSNHLPKSPKRDDTDSSKKD